MKRILSLLVFQSLLLGPLAQGPLTGSVDTPTFLGPPTQVPALSAASLGVHGIETISVAPATSSSSLPFHVVMTVQLTGPSDRQARPIDWDGGGTVIVNTGDNTAINCRVRGTRGVSDTTGANTTGAGLPILEDAATDQPHPLAPSMFSNRSTGEYFPDLVVESGNLSGDGTSTWATFRSSLSVFGMTVDRVVLDLSPTAPVFGDAVNGTQSRVFVTSFGNLVGWQSASGTGSVAGDVGGSVATAIVQEGPFLRRRIFWNGYGLTDNGSAPLDYGYDDPAGEVYDAAAFAGTTFVVRGSPGSGFGTEVLRIDTCALPSRISSSLGGLTVQFPIILPFDMSTSGKIAAIFVGPPIPPIDLTPFGFIGQWGIAPGSPAVVSFGSPSGFVFSFTIPVGIGAGSIPLQAIVLDPFTLGGFASNRALLTLQ
ncbi:MAG: hypothetical protein U1F36_23550 [Planctomycetota bacterium]